MRACGIFCNFAAKMKIIGFCKIGNQVQMVLKGDSSLLVNRKPFFIPDWSENILMTPCEVLRISRLGKNISPRFATRYFDAIAPGLNMQAADYVSMGNWVKGWAFDYSLVVGTFADTNQDIWQNVDAQPVVSHEEAIHIASNVMTIRQGDLIFIDRDVTPRPLKRDEVITEGDELYCKIK